MSRRYQLGTWYGRQRRSRGFKAYRLDADAPSMRLAVGIALVLLATAPPAASAGLPWQAQASGVFEDLNAVAAVDQATAWAVGNSGVILHTADGGRTWQEQPSGTLDDLRSVTAAGPLEAWVGGDSSTILHTFDGGATWTRQNPAGLTGVTVTGLSAASKRTVYAAVTGTVGVIATTDGGISWSTTTCCGGASGTAVAAIDDLTAEVSDDAGSVWTTVDGGGAWSQSILPGGNPAKAISSFGLAHAFAVGTSASTWHEDSVGSFVARPAGFPGDLHGVATSHDDTAWAVGDNGLIISTSTLGLSWTAAISPTADQLNAISMTSLDSAGWAVGISGAVVHLDRVAPGPPRQLAAIGGDGVVDLKWNPPGDADVAYYEVLRWPIVPGIAPAPAAIGQTTVTSFHDSGLADETPYLYFVEAVDDAGNGSDLLPAVATPHGPPGPPGPPTPPPPPPPLPTPPIAENVWPGPGEHVADPTPTLVAVGGDHVGIEAQVATDQAFATIVYDSRGAPGAPDTVTVPDGDALEPGTYWYRVAFRGALTGFGAFSTPTAFVVDPVPGVLTVPPTVEPQPGPGQAQIDFRLSRRLRMRFILRRRTSRGWQPLATERQTLGAGLSHVVVGAASTAASPHQAASAATTVRVFTHTRLAKGTYRLVAMAFLPNGSPAGARVLLLRISLGWKRGRR